MQEVGQKQRSPFLFSTVKGSTGHQESGAGVAGLQAASLLLQSAVAPAALHLRHLNPHVHGALAGHAVSIARGGPYGVATTHASGALMVGVSSFGAQGTNAHALLAGANNSSAAVVVQQAPAWRRSSCYAAPAVQQLIMACLLRGKKAGRSANVAFDSWLGAPRLAYLWQYSLQGRPHLPFSAVLSMAASLLPLLGATAPGEDSSVAAAIAAVTDVAMVAPAQLPPAAAAKVAPAVVRTKLTRASGAVQISMDEQTLLTAKLAATAAAGSSGAPLCSSGCPVLRVLVAPSAALGGSPRAASSQLCG